MRKLTVNELNSFLIDSSERILDNHLYDFVSFKLVQEEIKILPTSAIFCQYIEECGKYFLLHFSSNKTDYLEPQILQAHYLAKNEPKESTDLFILSTYFAIYKNQKLLFFKQTNHEVQKEQVEIFVQKSLNISVDRIFVINSEQEENLQKEFEENIKIFDKLEILENNQLTHLKKFIFFCIFCIILIISLFGYSMLNANKNNVQKKEVDFPKKELLSWKIISLLQKINTLGIKIVLLKLSDGKLELLLQDKQKEKLIEFLTKNKGEIKSLQYNKREEKYELNVLLKLS